MNTALRTAFYTVVDRFTGAIQVFRVVAAGILAKRRKIPASHGKHITGREPVDFYGPDGRRSRRTSVAVESFLERQVIRWLAGFPGLTEITSQPLTVAGYVNGRRREYTPDLLVKFNTVPPELIRLGFLDETYVEVKPAKYARDLDVQLKLCILQLNTGVPAVVITEKDLTVPHTFNGGSSYVH